MDRAGLGLADGHRLVGDPGQMGHEVRLHAGQPLATHVLGSQVPDKAIVDTVGWGPQAGKASMGKQAIDRQQASGEQAARDARTRPTSVRINDQAIVLPPPNTPVATVLASLASLAERGSAPAACRIAVELQKCQRAAQALEMAAVISSSANPSPETADLAETMLKGSEYWGAACKGISADQLQQAFSYQTIAFDNGDLKLRRWYVQRPALNPLNFMSDLVAWRQYQIRATA